MIYKMAYLTASFIIIEIESTKLVMTLGLQDISIIILYNHQNHVFEEYLIQ